MDEWELGPHEPWDADTDVTGPSTDQQAFAAYEDAWAERDRTGRTSVELLVASLRARTIPEREYAEGTRLRAALFGSWDRGRRPRRMHGVIVRYRLATMVDSVRDVFGDDTPEQMRLPRDLVPARSWGSTEDVSLPFAPSGTFGARIRGWYEAVDGERERPIPVWLDTSASAERTPVMVGRALAGHTELPASTHERLHGATRKGRRVVATGDLWVKRRKGDTWRADSITAELPESGD
jgi:hypothetical protein